MMPPALRCVVGGLVLSAALSAPLEAETQRGLVIADRWRELAAQQSAADADHDGIRRRLHQLRNFEAMVDLVGRLAVERRPRRIVYLASGAHLAPLALCELLEPDEGCALLYTEIDAGVQRAIDAGLRELAEGGGLSELSAGDPIGASGGRRFWRFRLAGRPVSLELRVAGADLTGETKLIRPELVETADLLISHDWSGDPLVNLRIVYDVVHTIRGLDRREPPLLMIEDLERHPYPIDLSPFSPVARTGEPYGHREADRGVGQHGEIELGRALFGGGVLLDLADPCWRTVDAEALAAVFDLLLFSRFDTERQNVLEGGEDPLIAPALLDWYTGYGARTIDGTDLWSDPERRARMVRWTVPAIREMRPAQRKRAACRLQLYRCLLNARSSGADVRELMPSASLLRRPDPGSFPTPTMERMYREAIREAGRYRRAKEAERAAMTKLVKVFDEPPVAELLAACPVAGPAPGEGAAEGWTAAYGEVLGRLGAEHSHLKPKPEPEPVAVTVPERM